MKHGIQVFVLLNALSVASIPAFAAEDLTKQLESSVKRLDSKRSFGGERRRQDHPQEIGTSVPLPIGSVPNMATNKNGDNNDNQMIQMERPKLQALVAVNRTVSPFSLDAAYQQVVHMRDVLLTASGANIDILKSAADTTNKKWLWRQSLTDYLPSINLGMNEIGLNSISAIPIKATAVAPTGASASGTTAATAFGVGTSSALSSTDAATAVVTSLATKTVVQTPLTALQSGFTWKPIQGGSILFNALAKRNDLKAARAQLRGDISDVLLTTADDYYDLVYNEALLQIRTAAVRTDEEQVRQNSALEESGLATNLDILQAKTQLSKDLQNLVNQQRARRKASIKLAHDMNLNLGQDLLPGENTLKRVRLVSPELTVNQLLTIAIDHRPELKRYEELRLAAKKRIMASASGLLPDASLSGNIIGLQSKIEKMYPSYLINFGLTWHFDGLGMKTLTGMEASRWQARRAMLDANDEFLKVMDQVRDAYNTTLTSESVIEESTNEVLSAEEELRLARMRLDNGLGTNLDVLTAQRDLTEARLDKALALINFNKAQAQMLHDIGLISIDNLSSGLVVTH